MEYLDSTLDSGAEHGARIVVSDRARDACETYGVVSKTVAARKA